MRRRLLGLLVWMLAAVLSVLAIALVGARLYFNERRLTQMAQDTLNESLRGSFQLEGVRWSLPGRLQVGELAVTAPSGQQVVKLRHVRAAAAIWAIVGRQIRISDLQIGRAQVRWLRASADAPPPVLAAFQPVAKPEPDAPGRPWSVRVEPIAVDGIEGVFELPEGRKLIVKQARLEGASIRSEDSELFLNDDIIAPDVRMVLPALSPEPIRASLVARGIQAHITEDSASASADEIVLGAPGVTLSGSGSAEHIRTPSKLRLDVAVQGRIRVAEAFFAQRLQRTLPPHLQPSGRLEVAIQARGALDRDLQLELWSASQTLTLGPLAITGTEFSGTYRGPDATLAIETLSISAGEGTLELDGWLRLPPRPLAHSLRAELQAFPLLPWLPPAAKRAELPHRVGGTVRAQGENLRVPDTRLQGSLRFAGFGGRAKAFLPGTLRSEFQARVRANHARIQQATLSARATRLHLLGRVPLASRETMDLALDLESDAPGIWLDAATIPVDLTALAATARLQGSLRAPTATGKVTFQGLRHARLPPADGTLAFAVDWEARTAELTSGRVAIAGGQLEANAVGTFPPGELPSLADTTISVHAVELAPFFQASFPDLPSDYVRGRLFGALRLAGTYRAPQLGGSLHVQQLKVGALPIDTARAKLASTPGAVGLERLELGRADAAVLLSGRLLVEERRIDATVRLRDVELSTAVLALPEPQRQRFRERKPAGTLNASARASGPAIEPSWDADGSVANLAFGESRLGRLDLELSGTLTSAAADVALAGPVGALRARARLEEQSRVEGMLTIRELDLTSLVAWVSPELAALEGTLAGEVTAQGGLPYPRLDGLVVASGLRTQAGGEPTTALLRVRTREAPRRYEATARIGDNATASATLEPEPLDVDATLQLVSFDLTPWLPPLREKDVGLTLSATARLGYNPTTGFEAAARVLHAKLKTAQQSLQTAQPATIEYSDAIIRLSPLRLVGPLGTFRIQGRWADRVNIEASGRLDVVLATAFAPAVADASGYVNLQVGVRGTRDRPQISGSVGIDQDVSIRPRGRLREIVLERGRLRATPTELRIVTLAGTYGGGEFSAAGRLGLDGLRPASYDVTVRGRDLGLSTGDIAVEGNARLHVTGKGRIPNIKGRVAVAQGRYLKSFQLESFNFIAAPPPEPPKAPLEQRLPWLQEMNLELRVVTTGLVEVDVDAGAVGLSVFLESDLRVGGNALRPEIRGRVRASSGTITFPQAELDVTRAVVDFVPEPGAPIAAAVDILAEGEITPAVVALNATTPSYLVRVGIAGSLERMALELGSDPPLRDLEILALLVTGRPTLERQPGRGDGLGLFDPGLAFAGSQLAAPLSSLVEDQLERLLNLELDLAAEITAEGAMITATQVIASRIQIVGAYGQAFFGGGAFARAGALLQLTQRLLIEGQATAGLEQVQPATRNLTQNRVQLKYRLFGD